jgi:uncharacterized membrane protein YkoI
MRHLLHIALFSALLLAIAAPAEAAKTKEDAARQAARQNDNAKVLSVKEQKQNNKSEYRVKVLTKDGVVKTVRVPKDKNRR